ncbi:hypothetical protein SPRG_08209 [Saprolegnia parasitica CBS 223.65]|uniref:CUE domain-containing protein n=1 Tax=Saprolegnia parasitica (strain CBS 223.65) TaxID=695850 RepID=A0A067CIN4_SAPPC|nr:hypothetical protein SPRG_08209 [Saprolegnia parasitica CBS 223.65]KDO26406.1 hypothetical protein SPRG_08209 [Saprolegnia parasitica CBS 223.65]|eukprot:XP_012202843.1 hypothetical protein SPRG_08209 [Saprolegnia parasitica CBS 223.65]
MDQLQPIFPAIPAPVLEQVLRIYDHNLEAATDYLLENNWEELQMHNNTRGADPHANGHDGAGHGHVEDDLDDDEGDEGEGDDNDNDDDEDDEDEDDEDDDHMYYESGDDGEAGFRHRQIPPLAKRVKITTSADGSSTERFWVACDSDTVEKSMIGRMSCLTFSLSKVAHQRIVLLNQNTRVIDKANAELQLHAPQPTEATTASLKRKLPATEPETGHVYFFPIADLDMVWRSVLHAHVFNKRFGDVIEFHTASPGPMGTKAFDELFHIHTHQPRSTVTAFGASQPQLKCCLVLPCATTDDEINRVGKNVFSLLNLTGSLYFRSSSKTLGDDGGKLTEDVFRRYTTHRLVRHEEAPTETGLHTAANGILGYQPPKKIVFTLERLDANKRARMLSDDE